MKTLAKLQMHLLAQVFTVLILHPCHAELIKMPHPLLIFSQLDCLIQFDLQKPTDLDLCVEVLRPYQPIGVMMSVVSLPNHIFIGQA